MRDVLTVSPVATGHSKELPARVELGAWHFHCDRGCQLKSALSEICYYIECHLTGRPLSGL